MKLGEFLNGSGAQAPVKHVKFRIVGRGISGPGQLTADAEATLVFVPEQDRQEAIRDAHVEMRAQYKELPIPDDRLDDEIAYAILFRALRDNQSTNYEARFAESIKGLKSALVLRTTRDLWAQYKAFEAEEFPELIDSKEFEDLVKEAEGKSLAALLSECGFLKIQLALPSLAARFGK